MPGWMFNDPPQLGRDFSDDYFSELTHKWKRKRPIWIYLILSLPLTKAYVDKDGTPSISLDQYLSRWAKNTMKQGGAIELAEEQCQAFNEINSSLVE